MGNMSNTTATELTWDTSAIPFELQHPEFIVQFNFSDQTTTPLRRVLPKSHENRSELEHIADSPVDATLTAERWINTSDPNREGEVPPALQFMLNGYFLNGQYVFGSEHLTLFTPVGGFASVGDILFNAMNRPTYERLLTTTDQFRAASHKLFMPEKLAAIYGIKLVDPRAWKITKRIATAAFDGTSQTESLRGILQCSGLSEEQRKYVRVMYE